MMPKVFRLFISEDSDMKLILAKIRLERKLVKKIV
jgi:hypothetical protein